MELLGDSIADVKFNPDDLFLGGEDQDLDLEVSVLNLQKFSIALDLGMRQAVDESSLREAVMREQSFRLEKIPCMNSFQAVKLIFLILQTCYRSLWGTLLKETLK